MASIKELVTLYAARVPRRTPTRRSLSALPTSTASACVTSRPEHWWYIWGGTHWRPDDTLSAFNDARKICRAAPPNATKPGTASLARRPWPQRWALPGPIAAWPQRLASGTLTIGSLSTPAGTVDLRTGEQRAHRPGDYITKLTAVAPGGTCPAFLRFLAEVTDEDVQLQAFLQRLFGYALTGSTREHGLFFLHGLGANGKSVFVQHGGRYFRRLPHHRSDRDVYRVPQWTGIPPISQAYAARAW